MAHICDRPVYIAKDPFGILKKLGSGLGQADLPGRSEKQLGTKLMLQCRNPFRESGLAKSQAFACSSEVKFFGDGDEALQLSDVQSVTLC